MTVGNSKQRLKLLRQLLENGGLSTHEELVLALKKKNFEVTQSTISRDLKKLGAIRATDPSGRATYQLLPSDPTTLPTSKEGIPSLTTGILHNRRLIVIRTSPGSASLVARQLDLLKRDDILGSLAGDDTVFVAPSNISRIEVLLKSLKKEFIL